MLCLYSYKKKDNITYVINYSVTIQQVLFRDQNKQNHLYKDH